MPRLLWSAVVTLVIALLAYSQAVAYFGNESFHLLAAQLINAGKKPYLDFFYQHPPLFVYLNAVWMRIFGETWRSAHVLSALLTGGCIAVVANYVYSRLSDARWRLAISATTAALLGLNFYVVSYGTVAPPFGLCLLLLSSKVQLSYVRAMQLEPFEEISLAFQLDSDAPDAAGQITPRPKRVAARRGFAVDQATILPDHAHLLVRVTPKISVE